MGFFCIFVALTIASSWSSEAAFQCTLWANPLMDGGLALIVGVGCYFDQPFTAQMIKEVGIPAEVLADPIMKVSIMKAMAEEAMVWCWAFWGMTLVCTPPPLYVDVFGGTYGDSMYWTLTWVCTYGLQYGLLFAMLFRSFVLQPRERKAMTDWLFNQTPSDIEKVYGPPTTITVDAKSGEPTGGGGDGGGDGGGGTRVVTSMQRRASEEEGGATSIANAARVLARAFENDPLIITWPGVGDQPTVIKLEKAASFFTVLLRQVRACVW